MVISLDVKGGGKAVKRMQEIRYPDDTIATTAPATLEVEKLTQDSVGDTSTRSDGGAFARNPLLGTFVKPVWKSEGATDGEVPRRKESRNPWRRVQDDNDDNEAIILNGGVYGGREMERVLAEEPTCG